MKGKRSMERPGRRWDSVNIKAGLKQRKWEVVSCVYWFAGRTSFGLFAWKVSSNCVYKPLKVMYPGFSVDV